MENLYIINPEAITYFVGSLNRKKDNKQIYFIGIRINEVEKVLAWLTENEYNKLISSN